MSLKLAAAMKTLVAIFGVYFLISSISSYRFRPIENTKATCTIGDKTGDCCVWQDVKLFPGQELNHIGHCQRLYCTDYFSLDVLKCPLSSGRYEWRNPDISKPYPECCGEKILVNESIPDFG